MQIRFKLLCAALIVVASQSQAQTVGDVVKDHVVVRDARNLFDFAKVPLPPGEWEVTHSEVRRTTGTREGELRWITLMQVQDKVLQQAMRIVMKVNQARTLSLYEPCKIEPTLARNDYGTRFWKQKCLTLRADTFLQNDDWNFSTMADLLKERGIRHDRNSLVLTYSRFGDYHYLMTVRHFVFPSRFGLQNPEVSDMSQSPWHPSQVAQHTGRQRFVDALFQYGESIAPAYDAAYMREDSTPLPAFEAPAPLTGTPSMAAR